MPPGGSQRALAERLAAGPTRAMGAIRRNAAYALESTYAEAMVREAEAQRDIRMTHDAMEGGMAFLQKRKPNFTGA